MLLTTHICARAAKANSAGEYPIYIRITGKSYRRSLRIHQAIKKLNGKQSHQMVTVEDVCTYLGLEHERVKQSLIFF